MTECQTIEFKREYTDEIKNAIVAFLNSDGGTLYLGLNDDGSVQGLADANLEQRKVSNMVGKSITPDAARFVKIAVEQRSRKSIVRIDVQPGTRKPYYLTAKGLRPQGVFVRHGASSVEATESELADLLRETAQSDFEEMASPVQTLTFDYAATVFRKKGITFDTGKFRTVGITDKTGVFTNLGLILSDQCPYVIKIATFQGSEKSIFTDRQEFTGSIFQQIDEVFSYLTKWNRTRSTFEGLDRRDRFDYPVEALREALLNSAVHRDYALSGPVLISVFDDRCEFVNLGGLQRGVDLDDIMLGVSLPRNRNLAAVFYRLKLIEAYGTGIPKITSAYASCNAAPQFQLAPHAFKLTLPNVNFNSSGTQTTVSTGATRQGKAAINKSRMDRLRKFARKQPHFRRPDIEAVLDVSQPTAILILRELTVSGILVRSGNGRNTTYSFASNALT